MENSDLQCFSLAENLEIHPFIGQRSELSDCSIQKPAHFSGSLCSVKTNLADFFFFSLKTEFPMKNAIREKGRPSLGQFGVSINIGLVGNVLISFLRDCYHWDRELCLEIN